MYELKDYLADLRRYWGYTQRTMAEASGIPEETISNWERGKRKPWDSNIERLNRFFKFDVIERFYSRRYVLEERGIRSFFEPNPDVISNPNAESFLKKYEEKIIRRAKKRAAQS